MNRFIVFLFAAFCSFSFVARFFSAAAKFLADAWPTKIKRTKRWRVKIFNYRYVWRRFKLFPSSPVDCCVPVCVWVRALFALFFCSFVLKSRRFFLDLFFSLISFSFYFIPFFRVILFVHLLVFFIHVCYRWVCLFVYSIFMFQRFPCDVKRLFVASLAPYIWYWNQIKCAR